MKINQLILLAVLLIAGSCQSTTSSQRSVSVAGFVPMSGTSTPKISGSTGQPSDLDRSGAAIRLENRDGEIGTGIEVRQSNYASKHGDSDGIELSGSFRRYMDKRNSSLYVEASPILGLGIEDSSSYVLLRVAAGYRWAMAEDIFIDIDTGYYMTFMEMDFGTPGASNSEDIRGVDVGIAIGFNF
jgi:hypothetical protein